MNAERQSKAELLAENAELRARLAEAEETLRAIREGEVDAVSFPAVRATGSLRFRRRRTCTG